jgi:hypothetical protein
LRVPSLIITQVESWRVSYQNFHSSCSIQRLIYISSTCRSSAWICDTPLLKLACLQRVTKTQNEHHTLCIRRCIMSLFFLFCRYSLFTLFSPLLFLNSVLCFVFFNVVAFSNQVWFWFDHILRVSDEHLKYSIVIN